MTYPNRVTINVDAYADLLWSQRNQKPNHKLECIRELRRATGFTLRNSKEAVDAAQARFDKAQKAKAQKDLIIAARELLNALEGNDGYDTEYAMREVTYALDRLV